jgi:hypothetical protein
MRHMAKHLLDVVLVRGTECFRQDTEVATAVDYFVVKKAPGRTLPRLDIYFQDWSELLQIRLAAAIATRRLCCAHNMWF